MVEKEENVENKDKKDSKDNKLKIKFGQKITVVTVVFYGILMYAITSVISQEFKLREYDSDIEEYKDKIASQNEILQDYKNKKDTQNSDDIMEELARKLGYVKPSEKLYIDVNN